MSGYYGSHKVDDGSYALTWIERHGPGHFTTWDTGERYDWKNVRRALEDGNCPGPKAPNLDECTCLGVTIPQRMRNATADAIAKIKRVGVMYGRC